MQLLTVENSVSPDTPDSFRTTGVITLDGGEELRLWVDVPIECSGTISVTGNPWLVALLPIAASRGEDIRMSIPVDAMLLENLRGVLATWREWYPELHDVGISCPVAPYVETRATKTAAFFSGGIDSYFTIARRMPGNPYGLPVVGKVDDLLTVWGFDVNVDDEAQFRPIGNMVAASAKNMGLRHLILRTNLRAAEKITPFKDMWRRLSHGAALAFIGLILEQDYKAVIIGSTYSYGGLFPWGSHPMVDALFSTAILQYVHDGASFTRVDKTDLVANFPPAQLGIHVCFAQGSSNCSRCDKCYRTMITLDVLGHRECTRDAFDWSKYRVSAIRKLFIRSSGDRLFSAQLTSAARKHGRQDIVRALRYADMRSRLLLPFVEVSEWMMSIPGIWRWGIALKAFLLRGPIRKI